MGPILGELQELSKRLATDDFLGQGTLTVSEIFYTSPSRCAVADSCAVSIDRRLTGAKPGKAHWKKSAHYRLSKQRKAWSLCTPMSVPLDRSGLSDRVLLPDRKVEEDHFTVKTLDRAYRGLFNKEPVVDKWTFSTNGVSIMGRHGIPVIGFGRAKSLKLTHQTKNTERSPVTCAAMYAAIPLSYMAEMKK